MNRLKRLQTKTRRYNTSLTPWYAEKWGIRHTFQLELNSVPRGSEEREEEFTRRDGGIRAQFPARKVPEVECWAKPGECKNVAEYLATSGVVVGSLELGSPMTDCFYSFLASWVHVWWIKGDSAWNCCFFLFLLILCVSFYHPPRSIFLPFLPLKKW